MSAIEEIGSDDVYDGKKSKRSRSPESLETISADIQGLSYKARIKTKVSWYLPTTQLQIAFV